MTRPSVPLRALGAAGAALLLGACASTGSAPASSALLNPDAAPAMAPAAHGAGKSAAPNGGANGAASGGAAGAVSNGGTGASAGTSASAATAAGALKPFAEVAKDAQRIDGLLPLWRKDDKVWIEFAPAQFDKPFLLAYARTRGLGERGFYGNWLLDEHVVEFHRIGNLVQMIAKNTRFAAPDKTPLAAALSASFTDSLLASAPVASAPHPERNTVLVEANGLFLADLPALATQLEARYRLAYAFDARNSSFTALRATPDQTSLEVSAHYAIARLPAPPAGPVPPGVQQPTPPRNLVDARSMFIGYHYSLVPLPDPPMRTRAADDRVGHFVTERWDFGDELAPDTRRFQVNRWRLEKKDPDAPLSEPVRPIVFWLDRNIPARFRASVKAGVLEWNKAFERIGFKDAIRVEQEPDDADFDLADLRHASIRWFLDNDDGALAIGPSHVDPRTGEIVDADIGISDNWARLPRRLAVEQFPVRPVHAHDDAAHDGDDACDYAAEALADTSFALGLLEARGEIDPASPEAEAIVQAILKDVVTHEVGHTLGLRHNFRASTTIPAAKLEDKTYTREHGLSGSVMDYNAFNLALTGEPQGEYAMSTLGAYDYWAIEYAYKPFAPADEAAGLARIAARSDEPALAYGTDEEAAGANGYDPEVNQRDLGDDPLAFARRRMLLSQELWERLQTRPLAPGESYAARRRNVESGLRQFGFAAGLAAKYVGGVVYLRDHAGSARASFNPVPAARQREALVLLTTRVFASDALRFKPEFVARLAQDGLERGHNQPALPALTQSVFEVQKTVLDRVLSDAVANRLVEVRNQVADPKQALSLGELTRALQDAIWSELRSGIDIPLARRNLQREHLRRLAAALLKPSAGTPPDARAIARVDALELVRALQKARSARKLSPEARAHLNESLATLEETLRASLVRAGA